MLLALAACSDPAHGTSALPSTATTDDPSGAVSFPTTSPGPDLGGTTGTTGGSTGGSTGPDPAGDPGDPNGTIHFAVIGDFGADLPPEAEVAALVAARAPEFVITLGDNNYYVGDAATIDRNIGKYYHEFIGPYVGEYGQGAAVNRFFPCPGNHDWGNGTLQPYLDYFRLPGNERYYEFRRGPVHFFALDSDVHEPDGITADSEQALWLQQALAASDAPFKLVYLHHAPYSSGVHQGNTALRWPFGAWGADLVLTGHDHHYERLVVDGLPYIVNGVGGASLRTFAEEELGTQRGTPHVFGAMFVEADPQRMTLSFVSAGGGLVDRVTLLPEPPPSWTPLVAPDATWRWLQADPGPTWADPASDDATWSEGQAPLGVGVGGEATVLAPVVASWFRHAFVADAAAVGAPLRLKIAADDGAIVYLNGVEVYRLNLPEGPLAPESTAVTAVGWWYEDRLSETIIPGDALQAGTNVLAVELRQHDPGSADLFFALGLEYGG